MFISNKKFDTACYSRVKFIQKCYSVFFRWKLHLLFEFVISILFHQYSMFKSWGKSFYSWWLRNNKAFHITELVDTFMFKNIWLNQEYKRDFCLYIFNNINVLTWQIKIWKYKWYQKKSKYLDQIKRFRKTKSEKELLDITRQ